MPATARCFAVRSAKNLRILKFGGDCLVKGKKFWISAWVKTSEKSGPKYFSLTVGEAGSADRGETQTEAGCGCDRRDEIPSPPGFACQAVVRGHVSAGKRLRVRAWAPWYQRDISSIDIQVKSEQPTRAYSEVCQPN